MLPTSTFHDLVNKGKITPFKHIRGMYYLNASLRRLGLKEVAVTTGPANVQAVLHTPKGMVTLNSEGV